MDRYYQFILFYGIIYLFLLSIIIIREIKTFSSILLYRLFFLRKNTPVDVLFQPQNVQVSTFEESIEELTKGIHGLMLNGFIGKENRIWYIFGKIKRKVSFAPCSLCCCKVVVIIFVKCLKSLRCFNLLLIVGLSNGRKSQVLKFNILGLIFNLLNCYRGFIYQRADNGTPKISQLCDSLKNSFGIGHIQAYFWKFCQLFWYLLKWKFRLWRTL